ncbi:MAG TPA: metallophosphoesterase [Anaeromyxobacteraceae bacterium]|nr:metallophosphoesterase [Anaeromyxobacteraceae bacterium]
MTTAPARRMGVVGLALAFSACCCETSPTHVVRAPVETFATPRTDTPALRALFFGDFGQATCERDEVVEAMARAHAAVPFDVAIDAGDNLYFCGPDTELPGAADCRFLPDGVTVDPAYHPPYDSRFDFQHEWALKSLDRPDGSPVPTWLALGNHDVRTSAGCAVPGRSAAETARLRACLEVAHESPHWRIPGRHYLVDEGAACFLFVDSNALVEPYGGGFGPDAEIAFVQQAAPGCAGRPTFLVAHHPPATAGSSQELGPVFHPQMDALLASGAGTLSAVLAGHDHDLQHLRLPGGMDVFVSGSTCATHKEALDRVSVAGTSLLFGSVVWGFAELSVWADGGWGMRFVSSGGDPLHCCQSATPTAPCLSIACP